MKWRLFVSNQKREMEPVMNTAGSAPLSVDSKTAHSAVRDFPKSHPGACAWAVWIKPKDELKTKED